MKDGRRFADKISRCFFADLPTISDQEPVSAAYLFEFSLRHDAR